mmetsp:Transcript_35716/g.81471  ORF Transcript_35716/g.81471 Transcript_35716/m.81471 type:complete len:213 (-) Transcript_35716:477-1115(-)
MGPWVDCDAVVHTEISDNARENNKVSVLECSAAVVHELHAASVASHESTGHPAYEHGNAELGNSVSQKMRLTLTVHCLAANHNHRSLRCCNCGDSRPHITSRRGVRPRPDELARLVVHCPSKNGGHVVLQKATGDLRREAVSFRGHLTDHFLGDVRRPSQIHGQLNEHRAWNAFSALDESSFNTRNQLLDGSRGCAPLDDRLHHRQMVNILE